jgi:hypothetical protein
MARIGSRPATSFSRPFSNANARRKAGHDGKLTPFHSLAGATALISAATWAASVDERLLLEPGDLVLHVQFLSLQFRNFEAVDRRVCQRFGDFRFKGVVPSFELRKMRFDRHVACLLALMDAASPDQTPSLDYDSP